MEPTFSHAEVFPLIAELIVRAPADDSGSMPRSWQSPW